MGINDNGTYSNTQMLSKIRLLQKKNKKIFSFCKNH